MKTHVIYICILITLLSPISGYGQKIDKLLLNGKIDKAIKYCEKQQGKLNCFEDIANYYFRNADIVNAEKYYLKSNTVAVGLNKIAKYYLKNEDFVNAEKYFIRTEFPNEGLLLIADTYKAKGNYIQAEEYYEKIGLLEEGLNRIADVLSLDLNYSKALTYYKKVGKNYSIQELEKRHKEIIKEKEISGLVGLEWYTSEKKISIFNPRVFESGNLYLSYDLEIEFENDFIVIISYVNNDGKTESELWRNKTEYPRLPNYSMSLNTISIKLTESATKAKELKIYLIDADLKSSKTVSNIVRCVKN